MKVLLSIKPIFADRIFNGSKKYEFRKVIFRNPDINTIIVYASSPVQKVIGEFKIERILSHNPCDLWEMTKEHSGISENFFFDYFSGKDIGFAIKIKEARLYDKPLQLSESYNVLPPQSFCYV